MFAFIVEEELECSTGLTDVMLFIPWIRGYWEQPPPRQNFVSKFVFCAGPGQGQWSIKRKTNITLEEGISLSVEKCPVLMYTSALLQLKFRTSFSRVIWMYLEVGVRIDLMILGFYG
jgi:hypothetical protein